MTRDMASVIGRLTSAQYAQQGIAAILELGIRYKAQGIAPFIGGLLQNIKAARLKLNDTLSAQAADNAIKALNDAK